MSAIERYRLLLAPLLPGVLAEDYRAGKLTDVELEQVVRGCNLPEETIARIKSGELDRTGEPERKILLPGDVANPYGSTNARATQPGTVRGSSPIFGGRTRAIPPTVHADLDRGVMSAGTRWKPRRIACTDRPGGTDRVDHVVKLAQDPASAAALVSEWIGGGLLRAGGVPVLDPKLVVIGKNLPNLPPGVHFGTAFRADVEDVAKDVALSELADPQQLVDIWVFDTWLANIDRDARGNLLATRDAEGRLSLIAADQSDCFGGNGGMMDGRWRKIMRERGPAGSIACLNRAIMHAGGAAAIERALRKVDTAIEKLDEILAAVPLRWFEMSGLHREELRTALRDRRLHLPRLLALDMWKQMPPI